MPHESKLVRDLASREYTRLCAELNALVFDDSYSEEEKGIIQKYLHSKQKEIQVILNTKSNCPLP